MRAICAIGLLDFQSSTKHNCPPSTLQKVLLREESVKLKLLKHLVATPWHCFQVMVMMLIHYMRLFCRQILAFDFIFRCQRFLVLNLTGMFRAWPFWKRRTTIPWKLKIKQMRKTCCYRNPIRKYFVRPGTSGVLDFFLIPHWTPGWWWEGHEFESLATKRGTYL